MKKIIIIIFLVTLTISFSGCRKKQKTELHYWTTGNISYQSTDIIYELYGDPTKIIDGFYFEKDDIVLNIKYGWNEERIEYSFPHHINNNYKLICFASYIYLEHYIYTNVFDDYKNFEKSILIEEIEKEVFLSDYYKASLGKRNFFYTDRPTFSDENEGIKLKLTSEHIEWIEESTNNYNKTFYFSVVPVYYDLIDDEYVLDFGSKYDGIEIKYHYDEEKKLAYIFA